MPNVKQKLTAEINADAKPMQQALDAARRGVEQTAKTVQQTSQQTRQGYDRAAQAASKMGQTGASANITVAQAVRHPIQAVKTLAIEAKNAAAALLGIGRAGRQASAESKELVGALGQMVGMGSKMAIIAKGFQALGRIINEAVIAPIRDAYKETERLSNMRLNANMDIYGAQTDKWSNAKKELEAYYAAFEKASKATATEQDRLAEQMAKRTLKQNGITIEEDGAPIEKQVRQQLDDAQKKYLAALEGKRNEIEKAINAENKAMEQADKNKYLLGTAYSSEIARIQGVIDNLSKRREALDAEIDRAKDETPGEDFSRRVAAQAADRLARQMEEEAKAGEEAARRREEAEKRLAEAEERRAGIERRLADEGRLEAMQHTRDLLAHQMGRFGFSLDEYDEENLNESNLDRVRRRRNVRLDARIEAKRQRLAEGRKVHFTPAEQRRMDEWRALKEQDKGITAEEKAMQAAKRQETAAQELENAAKAIEGAAAEIRDAEKAGSDAGNALQGARALIGRIEDERAFFEQTKTQSNSAVPDYGNIMDDVRAALDGVKLPVATTTQPVERVTQPVATTTQPVERVTQPVATTTQPVEVRTQPVETREQPAISASEARIYELARARAEAPNYTTILGQILHAMQSEKFFNVK